MGRSEPRKRDLTDDLAALMASTRRMRRKLNLVEIASRASRACNSMGGVAAVAAAVGLSSEMLRQFLRVGKLAPEVKRLVARGKIQSVDIADRMSRLPDEDQLPVAEAVVRDRLRSEDVRAIVSLRRDAPDLRIAEVIQRVESSRPIKEYLVEFRVPVVNTGWALLKRRFARVVGSANIRSLGLRNGAGVAALNRVGKDRLAAEASKLGMTKRELVDSIVAREVP